MRVSLQEESVVVVVVATLIERFSFDYHYRYLKPVAIVVSFRLSTVTKHFKVVVRTFSQVSCF